MAESRAPEHQRVAPELQRVAPEHQGVAPELQGVAPEHQEVAPEHQGVAPEHQGVAPEHQGVAPEHQRVAPEHQGVAPEHQRVAPELQGVAPERVAPEHQRVAPELQRVAPEHQRVAPEHQRVAPELQRVAPEHQRVAPELQRVDLGEEENRSLAPSLKRTSDVDPSREQCDEDPGSRTVTESASHSLDAEDMCTLVQSSCTLADSSVRTPVLVCKRPMQLQHCNMVTTICRGALGSDATGPQLCQGSLEPQASLGPQGPQTIAREGFPCDSSQCYSSHFHHSNFEDTFAAYCHPQPIPAPSQLLPPLTGSEVLPHLSLPLLMPSLSETGLDAKPSTCCCQLGCSWVSVLPQMCTRTCDVGTLTVSKSLRDIGVQTENHSSHVFPQVCLTEETHRESHQTSSKSPVKEVKWDAEGMTWEVYGASVDPEELGLAIQKHLELQIKETASRAAKLSRQNTSTSRHSVSCQRKRRILGSLRPSACCTTAAAD